MYELYVNGRFYERFLAMEVALEEARKRLLCGENIEIRCAHRNITNQYTRSNSFDRASQVIN